MRTCMPQLALNVYFRRFTNWTTATAVTLSVDVKCAVYRRTGHEFVAYEVSN
jgi:hypothetical protein